MLAHPECPQDVLAEADYVGSTAGMSDYVGGRRPKRVVLITECSMADNVAGQNPNVEFLRPCNLCPHMKRITLPKILASFATGATEVTVDPEIARRARNSVETCWPSVSADLQCCRNISCTKQYSARWPRISGAAISPLMR